MKPIYLKCVKRNQFSKILEEEWSSHNSLESVYDELQSIQGNIEEITINYWIKEK